MTKFEQFVWQLNQDIQVILNHSIKKHLFPSKLEQALKNYNLAPHYENLLHICEAFAETTALQHSLFDCLAVFKDSALMQTYSVLKACNLLEGNAGQANFNTAARHADPKSFANLLTVLPIELLKDKYAQSNFNAVAEYKLPMLLVYSLEYFRKAEMLQNNAAQTNFNILLQHQDLWNVILGFQRLEPLGLLNESLAHALAKSPKPYEFAWYAIPTLYKIGFFKNKNIFSDPVLNKISTHQNPMGIALVAENLHQAKLLTSKNASTLNKVMEHSKILLDSEPAKEAWRSIPAHLLTQGHFETIIAICRRHQNNTQAGINAFIRYVNFQILGLTENVQSTHTPSVHVATDLTIWLLSTKYESYQRINLFESLLDSLKTFKTKKRFLTPKIDAAIRCITRLKQTNIALELSTQKKLRCLQLAEDLKLKSFLKEEDRHKEHAITLNDLISWLILETQNKANYLEAWVDALYEIQRGYNLNPDGQELEGPTQKKDLPICFGGTANKFCERLQGLSPLIVFVFISPNTILLKLRQLLNQTMIQDCQHQLNLIQPGDKTAQEAFVEKIASLTNPNNAQAYFEKLFQDREQEYYEQLKQVFPMESEENLTALCDSFKENVLPYYPEVTRAHNDFYSKETLNLFDHLYQQSEAFKKEKPCAEPSNLSSKRSFFPPTEESVNSSSFQSRSPQGR